MFLEKVRPRPAAADELAALKGVRKVLLHVQRELETLRATEQQHRLFFEKTPYARFVCDRRTLRFVGVNKAAVAMYGYSREEFERMTLQALCPADDVREFLDYCRQASHGHAVAPDGLQSVFRHLRKDGTILDMDVGVTLVSLRGAECYLILAQDVRKRRRVEQRLHVQAATTRALAEASTVAEAAPKIFEAICQSLGCDWSELWRVDADSNLMRCAQTWHAPSLRFTKLERMMRRLTCIRGEGLPGRVWLKNKPIWVTEIAGDRRLRRRAILTRCGLRSGFAFPIRLSDEVLGVIAIYSCEVRRPDKPLLQMLEGICSQVGQVMGRRRVERRLLEISEREQQRIGQDLHDGLCQQLAGAAYICDNLRGTLAEKSPAEAGEANRAAVVLRRAIDEARQLARGLSPVRLDSAGLQAALEELASTIEALFSIACRFSCRRQVPVYNPDTAIHVYRIAQEAIHNAITHGEADSITISLSANGEGAILAVRDNGCGLGRRPSQGKGIGLEIMKHRARSIGGQLSLRANNGGGTAVICTFPVKNGN
jgi:PAS domain S-box-containing protein